MNERIVRMLLAATTAAAAVSMPNLSHAATMEGTPAVFISEVAWAGSSLSSVDEWLELSNLSDTSVDIGGWTVAGAAASGGSLAIPAGSVIAPHSTFLIANYDQDNAKSVLDRKPDHVTASVSLSNSALSLVLLDASGAVRDAAGNGSAPLAGSVGGSGGRSAAMARRGPVTDGTRADAWAAATESSGFDAGTADLGTPGTLEPWFVPTPAPATETADVASAEVIANDAAPSEPIEIPPVVAAEQAPTPAEQPVASEPKAIEVSDAASGSVEIVAVPMGEPATESPMLVPQPTATNTLRINEFVSDATEEWIEIENASDAAVSLSGWSVTDASGKATALADEILAAGEYRIVTKPKGILNNDGDTISLIDPTGAVVDEIAYGTEEIPAPKKTESAARGEDGSWSVATTPTPGAENESAPTVPATETNTEETPTPETIEPLGTQDDSVPTQPAIVIPEVQAPIDAVPVEPVGTPDPIVATEQTTATPVETETTTTSVQPVATLLINEFVSDATEEWIEILNAGAAAVSLAGWSVTDASGKATLLADELLGAGGYAIVMKPKGILNNDGDTISLIDPTGAVIDEIVYGTEEIPAPKKTESAARNADGSWGVATTPTPGAANATAAESTGTASLVETTSAAQTETATIPDETFSEASQPSAMVETASADGANGNSAPTHFPSGTLLINEFASDAEDEWIEILNPYNNVIPLAGWSVTDASGKATFLPDQLLGMGQLFIVSNPKGVLNNDGDTIALLDPTGVVVDEIVYGTEEIPAPKKTESTARDTDGSWARTATLTPGAENAFPHPVVESATAVTAETAATATTVASTESSDAATEATSTAPAPWSGPLTLRLSELYPNTSGDDASEEFIEIENTGDADIDLQGWSIADASGKTFAAADSLVIAPHAFLALSRELTRITLNNDDDTVTLIAPNGTVVDTQTYAHAQNSSSLSLLGSDWSWSGTPTPNASNAVLADAVSSHGSSASGSGRGISAGTIRRSVEGTVLVAPGVLNSQTFYVQTEDGGTQVYKSDGDFPALAEGDVVLISGTQTVARGEERLKVAKTDIVRVLASGDPVEPEETTIAELSDKDNGRLVRVLGTVVTRSGDRVTVEDGASQISVRVADGTGIDASSAFVRGTRIRVTGILTVAAGKLTLLPRSPADVESLAAELPPAALATAAAPTGNQSAADRDATTAAAITVGVALLLSAYSARKFGPKFLLWYAKSRALRAAA